MTDAPTKTATATDDAAVKAAEAKRIEAEREAARKAGRRDADRAVGAVSGAAAAVVDVAKEGASAVAQGAKKANEVGIDGMAADMQRRGAEANKSLNIGSLLGGLGGLLLTYIGAPIFSNLLGLGDFMGTFVMIALAIPMMIMGSSQFGDTINGWLGRPKSSEKASSQAQGQAPAKAQAQGAAAQPSQAAAVTTTVIPNEALVAMLEDAKSKGINANHVLFRKGTNGLVQPMIIDIEKAPQAVQDLKAKGGVFPVATLQEAMDICKAQGKAHAVGFAPGEGDTVRPQGCVPKPAAIAAR
jgi:hypothetical protein